MGRVVWKLELVLRELGFGPNLQEHPGLAVSQVQISANLQAFENHVNSQNG